MDVYAFGTEMTNGVLQNIFGFELVISGCVIELQRLTQHSSLSEEATS